MVIIVMLSIIRARVIRIVKALEQVVATVAVAMAIGITRTIVVRTIV